MKTSYLLPLVILFVSFSSCQKEEAEATLSTTFELPPETYLSVIKETVLFQYDREDLISGEHSGWFIDKRGEVHAYTMSEIEGNRFSGSECTAVDLGLLHNSAEELLTTIHAEELVPLFRVARRIGNSQLNERTFDETQKEVTTLTTFKSIAAEQVDSDNCPGNGPHVVLETDRKFQVITLKIEGGISQANENENVQEIIDWLEGIQASMDL